MLQTIPIVNNKGGVAKTTTSINLSVGLAQQDKRVLLIDLDSQGSASLSLGVSRSALNPSTADVLYSDVSFDDAVHDLSIPNLDLLTGSLRLANAETRLGKAAHREQRLKRIIDRVDDRYDVVIVDCAPSTSLLTINALVAADGFIIPVSPSYLSLEGVISLGEVVHNVRQNMGQAAPVLGVLMTRVPEQDNDAQAIIRQVRDHYGGKVFDTVIHEDPALEAAPGHGESIFSYAPNSKGASEYKELTNEVADRLERYGDVYRTIRKNEKRRSAHVSNS
ncbi:MAG: ParA family protein [Longimonas sp.]|uniref:ParA family protein n=1 Tax=Longimonas sp. TaxID=2039626 RepID=UPI0039757EFA